MYCFGYKDEIAIFICTAIFKRHFMVATNVVGHKVNASDGAPPILSRKQGNAVICKLNRLVHHRILHKPYHRVGIDTEIFMDFCPTLRRIPIDRLFLVLSIPCSDIPHWNEGVSVQKNVAAYSFHTVL